MLRKSFFYNALVAITTVALVLGGFTSFQRKRSSFERLDFRWKWERGTLVVTEVAAGSGAEQAGLKAQDRIWLVGGVPASEINGVRETLRRSGAVPLLVARGDRTLTMTYAAPPLKIDYHYLFLTFIGFLYLAIGLFTLMRGRRNESLLFYFVSLLAFVVYVYSPDRGGKLDTTFKALWLVEEFARIFLPPLALHFFLRFPRQLFRERWVLPAIYVLPATLAIWAINLLIFNNALPITSAERSFAILDRWEMLHFAVYFTAAFLALTYTFRTANAAGQKKQIKWIYLGVSLGFVPFLILYLIPFITTGGGSAFTTAAILPLALIPLAFAVSILKYKLWDVEVVIREVLAYTVTFIFGMVAFSTVNLLLSRMLEEQLALERNFLAFASGLLIAGVLVPVKSRIENLLEMFFYGETYRHRRAIAEFAQEIGTYHDLHDLIQMIRERLGAAIHIERTNLYLREGDRFVVYEQELQAPLTLREEDIGAIPTDHQLVLDAPRLPDASEGRDLLLRAGYKYLFPLRHRGELLAMLLCGTKRNEEPLSRDDLQLIGSLTAPLALAIENARLYGRLRRQLDQIQSLKEYNENIIESSSSAIVVVAEDGTVLTANRAFWDLIAVEPESDQPINDLFPPAEALDDIGVTEEITFRNARNEEKTVAVSSSMFTADAAPEGTRVLVVSDVSDRVRLERELQDKERFAALGLLAAGVAHEMNTPLTGISSYAQLLMSDLPADDPRRGILKKMEMQTFRASHLVNNLLDFAANRPQVRDRVNLAEVVRDTLAMHEDLGKSKQILIHCDSQLPDLVVEGTSHDLQQVLTNLLLNARDAVSQRGNIWVTLRRENERALIAVRDDGKGVPYELQQKIFQPLVTTKSGRGGTGLGLAIVDRIVRGLGGEVQLHSEPGAGATFTISLPLTGPESHIPGPGSAENDGLTRDRKPGNRD